MKQHITVEQLNELSDEGKEKLRKWWLTENGNVFIFFDEALKKWLEGVIDEEHWEKEVHYPSGKKSKSYPLLSIGQMIEYLYEKEGNLWPKADMFVFDDNNRIHCMTTHLCDALWEAVKESLNK